ncbi:MAG: hypothetical protein HPY83_11770 [Anaerolineae bacterium]|nr:hypothetical protein [Anaerolineae bacterium]
MAKRLRLLMRLVGVSVLFGLLASLGVYCLTACWSDWAFQREFLSRLGSSLAAILVGVPIALGLRDQLRRGEMEEHRRSQAEHASTVLSLLRRELEHNGDLLLARQGSDTPLPSEPLKDDLWQALTRGGELPWLQEPAVLDRLASAYYYVRAVSELESAMAHSGAGFGPDGTLSEGFRGYLEDLEARALRHVVLALETVDEKMGRVAVQR